MRGFFLILLFSTLASGADSDPYAGVHFFELPNGLKVTLLPQPAATRVYVQVAAGVGHNEESAKDFGVAHAIEHALFRSETRDEPSFLDRLSADGADVNGFTLDDQTLYFASLPADRAETLVRTFGQMFRRDTIDRETIEKVKTEILLEHDTPGDEHDDKEGAFTVDLLEAQFGLSHVHPSSSRLVASIRALGPREVADFYTRYYHPRNLSLLVVGNFNETAVRGWITESFGGLFSGTRVARVEPLPQPVKRAFERTALGAFAPRITIGTKFWGAEPQDELVLHAYLDHLALRVMRILRTEKAQTYTVNPLFVVDTRKFGIALLSFETTTEAYRRNLAWVRDLIHGETRDKHLSDAELREIRTLFFAKLRAPENDVKSMRDLATSYSVFRSTYGIIGTPAQVFRQVSDAEFRDRLARLFAPERELSYLIEPPAYFAGDDGWLAGFAMLLALLAGRFLFFRPANERGPFRFYARARYTPSTWLLIAFRLGVALGVWGMLGMPFLLNDGVFPYLRSAYLGATLVIIVVYALGQVPRRFLVIDDRLIVKSLAFGSRAFPLSEIAEVLLCPPSVAMRRLHWRSSLTHLSFFRPGVLVLMRDGRGHYVDFDDAPAVARELRELLPSANRLPMVIVPPPIRNVAAGAR